MRLSILSITAILAMGDTHDASASLRGRRGDSAIVLPVPEVQHHRHLVEDFVPLSCNSLLSTATCKSFITVYGSSASYEQLVTIKCGECITMDHPGTSVEFKAGLDIQGKLIFPDRYRIKISATMIAVQGELQMTSTKPVDGIPDVTFTMTGNTSQNFVPIDSNAAACDGAPCVAGKKAIVVAGGKVNSKYGPRLCIHNTNS
jgi:G8 domain